MKMKMNAGVGGGDGGKEGEEAENKREEEGYQDDDRYKTVQHA